MKKILALVLSLVMAFSLAAPAFAAVPEVDMDSVQNSIGDISEDASAAIDAAGSICDSLKAEDYKAALDGAFDFAAKLFNAIHTLVCTLADIFDFDCPFCDGDKAANDGEDADKEDEPLYESAGSVIGEEFAGKEMKFKTPYPQNVDAAYVFAAPTASIEIDGIATANVKSVIILEEGATTGKIVFTSETTENYFHNVEGFKLIINNSGAPVNVVLKDVLYWTNGDVIANIGDYIEGPYTLTVI